MHLLIYRVWIMQMKKLYIEATSRCNLNCKMCFRNSWVDETQADMNNETFDKIIESINKLADLHTVMFAGMGEPLVHKNIGNMILQTKKTGKYVSVLTNAFLLDKRMSDALVDVGLDELWISIDGFDRTSYEKIQRGAMFDRLCENILYFSKIRRTCKLGFTFVMMEENIAEVKKLNDFADIFSADEINLSYCIPSYPVEREHSAYDFNYPVGKMRRLRTKAKKAHNFCPFIEENVCFVKWNGDVCPCMQLLHSGNTYFFEEKRKVLCHSFGNVSKANLNKIWNSESYINFRNKVHNFEFPDCTLCDGCDDRLSNEKDCMFNEKPTCGACLWAQGIARCP